MKKIWLLTTLLVCGLLLTGCNNNDRYITFEEQVKKCEDYHDEITIKHKFKWEWNIQLWNKTALIWTKYHWTDTESDDVVICIFDKQWNFEELHGSILPNSPHNFELYKTWIPWWYLYRNLDTSNWYMNWVSDADTYEQLQNDKNMILKYQTDTSASVNKFIDVIHDDLLKSCEQYGTNYENMKWTMYERDTCVDTYISELYNKLKSEINNPRLVYVSEGSILYSYYNNDTKNSIKPIYLWDDPVLLSYYNDLNWDHPFVRYFVDLYEFIKNQWYRATWMMPEYPIKAPLSENPDWWYWWDEEKWRELYTKNKTWFYTYWEWNITRTERGDYISVIASWIVFNGNMLEWIQNEYWYTFPYYTDAILQWTSPERWPIVLHQNDWYNDYIYQIISEWGGSWEFYILVWILKDWLRIPIWECWYMLFPTYPMLFGECKEWSNFEPLTILTQEYNFYGWNSIEDMADNFTFFLRLLESTRVLSK